MKSTLPSASREDYNWEITDAALDALNGELSGKGIQAEHIVSILFFWGNPVRTEIQPDFGSCIGCSEQLYCRKSADNKILIVAY